MAMEGDLTLGGEYTILYIDTDDVLLYTWDLCNFMKPLPPQ